MRVLVTGGAGFIGGHLVEGLCAAGHEVVVLDDLSTGRRENLAVVADRIDLRVGDVREREQVRDAIRGAGEVIHLAALPSVPGSFEDPVGSARLNVLATALVLHEAQRAGARRLVFASSSAVYGEPKELPVAEEHAPLPLSPYGAHKLTGEHLCRIAALHDGPDCLSFRYFNVYGPRQRADSDYAAVIPIFRARCRAGEVPHIHGNGDQQRDFIHVTDLVAAHLRALERPEPWRGATLNLATGTGVTIEQLARTIMSIEGIPGEPTHGPPRAGDIHLSVADITRLRKALSWSPGVAIEEGLRAG